MPVDSIEAASAWRAEHAAGRGTGFRSKGQGGQNRVGSLTSGGSSIQDSGAPPRRRKLTSIEASLKGAIEVEEAARFQVDRASRMEADARLPNLIAAYNKAREGRYDSEKRVLELLAEAGTLIPVSDAKSLVAKILGTLFSRLRAVPAKAAPRANPGDDLLAEEIIRTDIDAAIAETHAVAMESFGLGGDEIAAAGG